MKTGLNDITKYAGGLDKTKILNCYRKIPVFLGNVILIIKNTFCTSEIVERFVTGY